MTPGQTCRVRARVPIAHVRQVRAQIGQKGLLRDVEGQLAASGFQPTLAITQDPTDGQIFQSISRFDRPLDRVGLEILSVDPVDEPPSSPSLGASSPLGTPFGVLSRERLDPGLTADEIWTVRQALTHDTNPRHLYGLADTFSPFYPVAASILAAKATIVEGQAAKNAKEILEANAQRAEGAAREGVKAGKFPDAKAALEWLRSPPPPTSVPVYGPSRRRERGGSQSRGAWAWDDKIRYLLGEPPKPEIAPARAALERYAVETRVGDKSLPLSVARDEVRRAACDLMHGLDDEVRKAPAPVRDLARAIVTELGYGVSVVRIKDSLAALPPTGQEGFVSPSALQLTLANGKPIFSRVANRGAIAGVMTRLESPPGGADLRQYLLAKNQVERAERAIERRRWVDWHRRAQWQWR